MAGGCDCSGGDLVVEYVFFLILLLLLVAVFVVLAGFN